MDLVKQSFNRMRMLAQESDAPRKELFNVINNNNFIND